MHQKNYTFEFRTSKGKKLPREQKKKELNQNETELLAQDLS
jgi:hypothetical protein